MIETSSRTTVVNKKTHGFDVYIRFIQDAIDVFGWYKDTLNNALAIKRIDAYIINADTLLKNLGVRKTGNSACPCCQECLCLKCEIVDCISRRCNYCTYDMPPLELCLRYQNSQE
jgi:hypothetical protein